MARDVAVGSASDQGMWFLGRVFMHTDSVLLGRHDLHVRSLSVGYAVFQRRFAA